MLVFLAVATLVPHDLRAHLQFHEDGGSTNVTATPAPDAAIMQSPNPFSSSYSELSSTPLPIGGLEHTPHMTCARLVYASVFVLTCLQQGKWTIRAASHVLSWYSALLIVCMYARQFPVIDTSLQDTSIAPYLPWIGLPRSGSHIAWLLWPPLVLVLVDLVHNRTSQRFWDKKVPGKSGPTHARIALWLDTAECRSTPWLVEATALALFVVAWIYRSTLWGYLYLILAAVTVTLGPPLFQPRGVCRHASGINLVSVALVVIAGTQLVMMLRQPTGKFPTDDLSISLQAFFGVDPSPSLAMTACTFLLIGLASHSHKAVTIPTPTTTPTGMHILSTSADTIPQMPMIFSTVLKAAKIGCKIHGCGCGGINLHAARKLADPSQLAHLLRVDLQAGSDAKQYHEVSATSRARRHYSYLVMFVILLSGLVQTTSLLALLRVLTGMVGLMVPGKEWLGRKFWLCLAGGYVLTMAVQAVVDLPFYDTAEFAGSPVGEAFGIGRIFTWVDMLVLAMILVQLKLLDSPYYAYVLLHSHMRQHRAPQHYQNIESARISFVSKSRELQADASKLEQIQLQEVQKWIDSTSDGKGSPATTRGRKAAGTAGPGSTTLDAVLKGKGFLPDSLTSPLAGRKPRRAPEPSPQALTGLSMVQVSGLGVEGCDVDIEDPGQSGDAMTRDTSSTTHSPSATLMAPPACMLGPAPGAAATPVRSKGMGLLPLTRSAVIPDIPEMLSASPSGGSGAAFPLPDVPETISGNISTPAAQPATLPPSIIRNRAASVKSIPKPRSVVRLPDQGAPCQMETPAPVPFDLFSPSNTAIMSAKRSTRTGAPPDLEPAISRQGSKLWDIQSQASFMLLPDRTAKKRKPSLGKRLAHKWLWFREKLLNMVGEGEQFMGTASDESPSREHQYSQVTPLCTHNATCAYTHSTTYTYTMYTTGDAPVEDLLEGGRQSAPDDCHVVCEHHADTHWGPL